VEPDSTQEIKFVVGYAAREGVPVVPVSSRQWLPDSDRWFIRMSMARMTAISDFSTESGLVCVEAGARMQNLSDWLMDKGYALAVRPDHHDDMEVWEFLISPTSGNYGPRYGCKWDQVFALTAVVPNGRLFRNSLAPGRATGPDFSRVILLGRGAFGLPVEVYFRVRPLPNRRRLLSFALSDLAGGIERAWEVAAEANPEFLEVGFNRHPPDGLPETFALVELWDEGSRLSMRRELVRKNFGEMATPTEVSYDVLVGFEDTYEFDPRSTIRFYADRSSLGGLMESLRSAGEGAAPARLRVRGFVDDHVCVTAACEQPRGLLSQVHTSDVYSSPDGQRLLAEVAGVLDPQGVFSLVPQLW